MMVCLCVCVCVCARARVRVNTQCVFVCVFPFDLCVWTVVSLNYIKTGKLLNWFAFNVII